MHTLRLCSQCYEALPPDSTDRLCPKCQSDPRRATAGGITTPAKTRPTPPPPAEIAQFFPQLEILELLGQGGMGMVYLARQPQLQRLVALKILSPELTDTAFAGRFSREARSLARLNHSSIVNVFDFGQADRYYYLLMEYVEGANLREVIQRQPPTPEEARRIVMEVCGALQYAHEEGIVHRDIKPSNILIDKKGRVKIADFGLAKLTGADQEPNPALTTAVMGTPHYMAPEQIETPGNVDHRADIYSLGVVLYEMLTGELPLGRFEPPSVKNPAVDVRLDNLVLRALEKNRERRFQQAGEVRAALETTIAPPAPAASTDPSEAKKPGRHWTFARQIALMAGTALFAVIFYTVAINYWHPSQPVAAGPARPGGGGPDNSLLGKKMIDALQLTRPEVVGVNRIIRRYQREYAALERQHTKHRKDAAGHVHIIVAPFADEMQSLIDQMWKDLAGVLTPQQLAAARKMNFDRFFPHTGKSTVRVEIWRDATGEEHYVESEDPGPDGTTQPAGEKPQGMPLRYRPYLTQP